MDIHTTQENFVSATALADGRDAYNFSAGPCVIPKAVLK